MRLPRELASEAHQFLPAAPGISVHHCRKQPSFYVVRHAHQPAKTQIVLDKLGSPVQSDTEIHGVNELGHRLTLLTTVDSSHVIPAGQVRYLHLDGLSLHAEHPIRQVASTSTLTSDPARYRMRRRQLPTMLRACRERAGHRRVLARDLWADFADPLSLRLLARTPPAGAHSGRRGPRVRPDEKRNRPAGIKTTGFRCARPAGPARMPGPPIPPPLSDNNSYQTARMWSWPLRTLSPSPPPTGTVAPRCH